MMSLTDIGLIDFCIEWFLYGKISIICALTYPCQLLPGLGLYSGIFAVYLQHRDSQNKSRTRTASIIFYALCVLYILSTVNVVLDLANFIIQLVSNNPICKNIIFSNSVMQKNFGLESIYIGILQTTVNGCCDFLAQCILVRTLNHCTHHDHSPKSSKIYRCWIVWGQIISVVIVPSFLAITYLGQSIDFHLIGRLQFIVSSYLFSDDWCSNIFSKPYCDF